MGESVVPSGRVPELPPELTEDAPGFAKGGLIEAPGTAGESELVLACPVCGLHECKHNLPYTYQPETPK